MKRIFLFIFLLTSFVSFSQTHYTFVVSGTSLYVKNITTNTDSTLLLGGATNGTLPFANGGISAGAATTATTGTMTVSMVTSMITITPTGACTFNASGGVAGQQMVFIITTSGVSSFTLTWGTNFRTSGTLATGTTTAKKFTVSFIYDGSLWLETSRTAAM